MLRTDSNSSDHVAPVKPARITSAKSVALEADDAEASNDGNSTAAFSTRYDAAPSVYDLDDHHRSPVVYEKLLPDELQEACVHLLLLPLFVSNTIIIPQTTLWKVDAPTTTTTTCLSTSAPATCLPSCWCATTAPLAACSCLA